MRALAAFLALCFLLLSGSEVVGRQATPNPDGITISETDTVRQVLWGDDAALLDDGSGSGPIWKPVSARFIVTETDMNIDLELVNTSGSPQVAPLLTIELLTEGDSYGTDEFYPENKLTGAGGSVFYQDLNVFGGSLLPGDWDEEVLSLSVNSFAEVDLAAYDALSIEGERITNNGDTPIGEVYFLEVERDGDGIFTASCSGILTGANILPGKSVRAPGLDDTSSPGGCGFAYEGEAASESLGIGGPYSSEYVLAAIQAPT